jgi:tRNA pseudouridine55 synthase
LNGLLLVDKPVGISSFDVIRHLRRSTGVRKIGHAGTLDPLASGLMLLLFGTATKQAEKLSKLDKRYVAQIRLGMESTTGDEEGEKTPVSERVPALDEVEVAMKQLTGDISQVPSAYSAIKINGREAYKRVRAGETVEMPVRRVTVHEFRVAWYDYPMLEAESHVSSGTYIRTLAADLGHILETGAYLTGLVRTSIGHFELDESIKLDDADAATVNLRLLDIA